jgi:hypothetical protein
MNNKLIIYNRKISTGLFQEVSDMNLKIMVVLTTALAMLFATGCIESPTERINNSGSLISTQQDNEDFKKLYSGIISFKPKIPMVVNDTTDVVARIAPNNTTASNTLYAIKETDDEWEINGLNISKWMQLSLKDPEKKFEIETISNEIQKVLPDVPATWRWTVTPKEEGKHRLILVATLLEEKENGDKEPLRDVDIQEELIEVIANKNETPPKPIIDEISTTGKSISSFISTTVALLTGILGLIILYRKIRKGEGD